MKTRTWLLLLAALLLVSTVLSFFTLSSDASASRARILSDGKEVATVLLAVDREFTVTGPNGGVNVVSVRDGAIAVTEASCPDRYCMHRGFCSGGSSIVCLPNRLVIEFLGAQEVDSAAG